MKLIVPMARKKAKINSKFIPPNPLMSLAGKPIILRVLEVVKKIKIDEVIFIVDDNASELKKLVSQNLKFKARYVLQKDQKGVAHAVYGAKKYVGEDSCLILFADSIINTNLKDLNKINGDAIIWTKQVDDPRQLGVVFTYNGFVSRLIEKPETPVSDLAMVGLYYFKNSKVLFESIAYLIKNKILTKGAYQLTDALQIMINKGAKIIPKEVESWFDCGSKKKLLETLKAVIVEQRTATIANNNVLIKPVFVEKGASVRESIIGPNVSIGKNAKISRSIISNSIIGDDALIDNNNLTTSFIGKKSKVFGSSKKINVKDQEVLSDE